MKFRKIVAVCILSVTGLWAGHAQNDFKRELTVGPSFGTSLSSVTFNPKVPTSLKIGFGGGATLRWITENHLGLQVELNYAQQGWKEKFEEKPEFNYSRTLNYLELPFLTHIYFGKKNVRVFLNLGPKLGFLLNESTDSNLNGENPNPNRPEEQHDLAVEKKFDWGLCGGPGIEIRTGIGSFLLEGRYYYALGDIFNNRKGNPFPKSSNQVISAKITYLIPLFKK